MVQMPLDLAVFLHTLRPVKFVRSIVVNAFLAHVAFTRTG